MTAFDAAAIQSLLGALDEQLAARGTTADIYLVGGAAIALSFDAARTTRDLDAVFAPTSEVRAAARNVADQFGLAEDWLNDAVKGFVPPGADAGQRVVFESAHLRVCVAGAEHLLAMKVAAARVEQDRGDLAHLVEALGLRSADQALQIARDCLGPAYPIPPRALYLLDEIFEEMGAAATPRGVACGANPPVDPVPDPPPISR
jgi:hypothetical protein